jgi:hypothetical protein
MKFYGTPNLFVRFRSPRLQKINKNGIFFDANGEYETDNATLIKSLKIRFKFEETADNQLPKLSIEVENNEPKKPYHCKNENCTQAFENIGLLMKHKKGCIYNVTK